MPLYICIGLVHTECPKCDTLIDFHMVANHRSFTNHHPRTMIDTEVLANSSARVNINTGTAMCDFDDHPWKETCKGRMMYIGLDLGTSGLKGILIDDTQGVLAEASAPLSVSRPHEGWSEQSPADWISAAEQVLQQLAVHGWSLALGVPLVFALLT